MTDQPAAQPTPDRAAFDLDELQARRKPFDGQLSVKNIDRLFVAVEATAAERDRLVKVNEGLVAVIRAAQQLRAVQVRPVAGWAAWGMSARAVLDEARKP